MSHDDLDVGKQRFAEKLRTTTKRCPACGFEDTILDSPWRAETHTDANSGHVMYQLTCTDCNETTVVEINLP